VRRLRRLSEEECYFRCYGEQTDTVRVLELEPPRPRDRARLSGEELRREFEQRLDVRGPESELAA
jgi:hypothetical protein